MTSEDARRTARATCTSCRGSGFNSDNALCECVAQRVFKTCLSRYELCDAACQTRPKPWQAEYRADFIACAKRALPEENQEWFFHTYYIASVSSGLSPQAEREMRRQVGVLVGREIAKIEGRYALYTPPEPKKEATE